jgi:hypothetical protein
MTNTAKRKQLIARTERMTKGVEVTLDPSHYQRDLIMALNYYNTNHDDKEKKKWFITHYAKIDKKAAVELLKVDEQHFRHAGILARMIEGGSVLLENEMRHLTEKTETLLAQIQKRQKSQDVQDKKDAAAAKAALPSNVISIQQRMEDKAHDVAGEIEGAIDDFMLAGCKGDFSAKNYLMANQVAGPIAKRVGDLFVKTSNELHAALAGDDEQLVEGYSNFTKRELKRFAEFVDGIIADCNQMVQTAKANRAPRKRKEVPAAKQVARMKYLREFAEMSLKSVNPANIIGSSEVWFYNTKYRRVGVYRAEGTTLAVKGTTIIGFDIKESKAFTLRKPEEFFKGLSLGKRALTAKMKTLTTKPAVPNGRINEETILLGAF